MKTDQEFREEVLVILTDVQTKMNSLVGADGTNGRIGVMDSRITNLEQGHSRIWGAGAAVVVIWTALVAVLDYFKR